jgi:hypothetical protein
MKRLLMLILPLVAACGGSKPEKQYPGTPPAANGSHVVAQKIAPDTLVDSAGFYCVVKPAAKFEGADVGAAYDNCAWSDSVRHVSSAFHFSLVSTLEAQTLAARDTTTPHTSWIRSHDKLVVGVILLIALAIGIFMWRHRNDPNKAI